MRAAEGQPGNEATKLVRSKANPRESLLFQNGDLLYGSLESIEPERGIRWHHPDVDQIIEFASEHIAEIHFPPRPSPRTNTANLCQLHLSNSDDLEGAVVQMDRDKVVLQSWYAGDITIPRKAIGALTPVPPEGATVFRGPSGLEGWTIGKVVSPLGEAGEWKYRNGAFYATNAASIARDVKLPDTASIQFDLAWKGLFQLAFAVYTDYLQPVNLANKDTEPEFGGFYSLQLNSFSANLLPVKKNDPLRYLGQVSVPAFNQKNAAHVELRMSKAKRSITLMVDGLLIKQWVDSEEFAGQGTGVRLVHQGQGKVKVSNFRVSEWDGQFDEKPSPVSSGKLDLIRLRNGDRVSGQVDAIDSGKIAVSIGSTKLEIPLARVKLVEFAGQKSETAPPDQDTVRAVFYAGGGVTFKLVKWEGGKVVGTSTNFGSLTFDASAFSRVELRPK